jgi:tetrahydromethanopterin S-methyltransferase subunit G
MRTRELLLSMALMTASLGPTRNEIFDAPAPPKRKKRTRVGYAMPVRDEDIGKKIQGRNEQCACGSGKKFKKCCINGPRVIVPEVDYEAIREKIAELKQRRISLLDKYGVFGGGHELNDVFDNLNKRIDELEATLPQGE